MPRTADERYAIVRDYTAEQREEDRARIRKTGAARMATIHAAAKAEWDAKVAAAMEAEKAEKEKCPSYSIQIPSNDAVLCFASQASHASQVSQASQAPQAPQAPHAPRAYHFQPQPTDAW